MSTHTSPAVGSELGLRLGNPRISARVRVRVRVRVKG